MAGSTARNPLPQLTLDNEFFWKSGADGKLRIQQCEPCSSFIHPPQPVCPYCRSHAVRPAGVSGYATLIGFTVSHRFTHPGLPSPYVSTRETLGWIALNQRANAALNPTAIYRDPMTMEDYLSARSITTPFGLYDCDVPCDASTRRRRVRPRPVRRDPLSAGLH